MGKRKIGRLAQNDIRAAPGIGISWTQPGESDAPSTEERIPIYRIADIQRPSKESHIEIHPYDLLAMGPDDEEYDPSIWARGSTIKVSFFLGGMTNNDTMIHRNNLTTSKNLLQT